MLNTLFSGVIEGFYGKTWSWQERADMARFLKHNNFQFYIYAPKADGLLRKNWQENWPASTWQSLRELREVYRQAGILWGIGLSPFEVYREWGSFKADQLLEKIQQINGLEPDIFCLLFDDMAGDIPELASLQAEIANLAARHSHAETVIICPTYYSFDPILEQLFGARPANYWAELGTQLQDDIRVFWTGDQVCSTAYDESGLIKIGEQLRRKPFIWDNYPVNDGRRSSQFLNIDAFQHRPAQLRQWSSGHAVNPMNAFHLSCIPLLTLVDSYRLGDSYQPGLAMESAAIGVCGKHLAQSLINDIDLLQYTGLDNLSSQQIDQLLKRYQAYDHSCAREVCCWLQGHYRFDPACLTG